jgi:hypothetical protein
MFRRHFGNTQNKHKMNMHANANAQNVSASILGAFLCIQIREKNPKNTTVHNMHMHCICHFEKKRKPIHFFAILANKSIAKKM